jgi:hypothetical protein
MTGTHRRHLSRLAGVLALVGFLACEPTAPRLVPVHLYLTDAPNPNIASAVVHVSRAYLVPTEDAEEGQFVTIFDERQEYDLLMLQNSVTALLGREDVPTGTYAQLRLVVESAEITLAEGVTFDDGSSSRTLFVPSGMETGIKVEFGGPLKISGETGFVVDFDVGQKFVLLGPPGQPMDVLFTPLLVGAATES